MAVAAAALKTQLEQEQARKDKLEKEIDSLKGDSGMLSMQSKLMRLKDEMKAHGCVSKFISGKTRRFAHPSCKDDTKCEQRPWIASNGEIWCSAGDDNTTAAFNNADNAVKSWIANINGKQAELAGIDVKIKAINKQLLDYANTPAGKKEIEDIGEVEKQKAQTQQVMVMAQAKQAEVDAEKAKTKKIITITVIIVLILALAGGIFWYIKKRKAGKK